MRNIPRMSICQTIALHLSDVVTSVINAGKVWCAKKKKNQYVYQDYAPWSGWGLLGICGWRRDVPGWLPGVSCFEDFCRAAAAEARMPPAVWEVLVEEAFTTNSIFPSSLTSRVRISSSNTAIVLFRSAACKGKRRKEKQTQINAWECFLTTIKHRM